MQLGYFISSYEEFLPIWKPDVATQSDAIGRFAWPFIPYHLCLIYSLNTIQRRLTGQGFSIIERK
jgi:hypothetical protein